MSVSLHAGRRVAGPLARMTRRVVARATLGAALTAAAGFAAYALAAPAKDAKLEVTRFSAGKGLTGEFARCPPGKRVVGGGMLKLERGILRAGGSGPVDGSTPGAPSNPAQAVANTGDGDLAKRWYAGYANPSSKRRGAKVLAICSRGSDARVEATNFWVGARASGHASATCPAGKRAVGGGVIQYSWPDNAILASAPLDASGRAKNTEDGDVAKRWYALIHNYPNHRVRFKVFALCSADSRARIEVTRTWAKAGGIGRARARCGSNRRALGGGVVESHKRFLRVWASGPLDATGVPAKTTDGDVAKQWYGAVENTNPERVRVKVLAICEPR